ncbi:unnamed protein product [Auanema sp. JU1783]|nr:unnamed protein product [Auanema sp. JU1783]
MNLEESTERIMERVRQRKMELNENEDPKENMRVKENKEQRVNISTVIKPVDSPLKPWNNPPPPPPSDTIPEESAIDSSKSKSTFAALAEDLDDFVCSPQKEKPKEAYLKGKSPRLSIGETRSSVLCTPAGFNQMRSPNRSILGESTRSDLNKTNSPGRLSLNDDRRIRFAHPISATTNFIDDSSMTYSQTETSVITLSDSTLPAPEPRQPEEECGAHMFMRKKTPTKSESSSSIKICSPKPFNPTNTSSPKVQESSIKIFKAITTEIEVGEKKLNPVLNRRDFVDELENSAKFASCTPTTPAAIGISHASGTSLSPARSVAIENAKAKTIAQQLEQKLKGAPVSVPTPKTTFIPTQIVNREVTPRQDKSPIKTQWRGATGTPVVVGKDPCEPTKPDVRASNLKSLKNRWEFSSLTGTPIHPDESEDSLVKTAIRIRDTAIPSKGGSAYKTYGDTGSAVTTPLNERKTYANQDMDSPCAKSPRYCGGETAQHELSPTKMVTEEPETIEEEIVIENDESINELDNGTNMSRFIDDAFDFMSKSPNKSLMRSPTKSLRDYPITPVREAPLAAMEKTPDFLEMDFSESRDALPEVHPSRPYEGVASAIKACVEESEEKGSRLPYTISFYRKRGRMQSEDDCEKIDLNAGLNQTPNQQIIGGVHGEDLDENTDEKIKRMEREIKVQVVRIQQASRALEHCRQKEEFRGSREEVTAQRALLLAGETRLALQAQIEKLNRGNRTSCSGPRGAITIRSLRLHVNRDFVGSASSATSSPIYYFCVLLTVNDQVHATTIATSDECMKKKDCYVEYTNPIELVPLDPDFVCTLEVYALRGHREQFTHEEKYRLRGTQGRNKTMSRAGMNYSTGGPGAIHDVAFNRLGRAIFDINVRSGQNILQLQDSIYPLDGTVSLRVEKRAVSRVSAPHRGFLSMFQRTKEGLGSWNRYWCVLESGEMKFWKCPEDETNPEKTWLVLLDLQTCAGDGASTIRETCPYPNSFHIDVWVPKEIQTSKRSSPEMEKLRVMLAADTKSDMNVWIEAINTTTMNLLMWQKSISG